LFPPIARGVSRLTILSLPFFCSCPRTYVAVRDHPLLRSIAPSCQSILRFHASQPPI
jgi:hypothetical protein